MFNPFAGRWPSQLQRAVVWFKRPWFQDPEEWDRADCAVLMLTTYSGQHCVAAGSGRLTYRTDRQGD